MDPPPIFFKETLGPIALVVDDRIYLHLRGVANIYQFGMKNLFLNWLSVCWTYSLTFFVFPAMAFDLLHIFKSNLWRSAGLGAAPHMLQGHHRKQTPWNFIVGPIWCKHSYHICRYKVVPIPTEAKTYQYMWIYRHINVYISFFTYISLFTYICMYIDTHIFFGFVPS